MGDLDTFIFQTPAAVNKIKEIMAQRADCVSVHDICCTEWSKWCYIVNMTNNGSLLYVKWKLLAPMSVNPAQSTRGITGPWTGMKIVIYVCSPYFPLPILVQDSRQICPITVLSIPRCFYFVPVADDVLCNISEKRNWGKKVKLVLCF
jgi:hypothetical protein